MPYPSKVQPVGVADELREPSKTAKSRLKRLFDRPFTSVLKGSSEKLPPVAGEVKDWPEFEPSSVCLDKMVRNFLEDNSSEKPHTTFAQKCSRTRCNCFNGNSNDSSDDEFGFGFGDSGVNTNSSFSDAADALKSLIPCPSTVERNLLADTAKIVEKHKSCKRKNELRMIVTDGLLALGFNTSVCKSKWDKSSTIPAGEYEYIDVIVEGERVLIDVDFRSEFEIARSTTSYKAILQSLPSIFVGKSDRLKQIVAIVSEAARMSLKRKGMHVAPWRKAEYNQAKWLTPHHRDAAAAPPPEKTNGVVFGKADEKNVAEDEDEEEELEFQEFELVFGEKAKSDVPPPAKTPAPVKIAWIPPVMKPLSCERSNRVVAGLASLLREKP